jgi:hypothetical protein
VTSPSRGVIVALLVGGACLSSGGASQATTASPQQTGKLVSTAIDSLSFVPGSDEAWALGSVDEARAHPSFALRRRGGRWVQEPLVVGVNNQLVAIAAGSRHSVWAVGARVNPSVATGFTPLIERSSGGRFRRVTLVGGLTGALLSVCASSATNVWAAGLGSTLLHWNGHVWRPLTDNISEPGMVTFLSVSSSGPRNVWAIGYYADTQGHYLFVHWNGKTWSSEPAPSGVSLTDIATTSAARVWAVGYKIVNGNYYGYAAHRHGQSWTGSRVLGLSSRLVSVSAVGAHAFAVGEDHGSTHDVAAITEWSDGGWHHEMAPQPRITSSLYAVAASSPNSALAGGEDQGARVDGTHVTHNLTALYNRHRWSTMGTPTIRS